MSECATLTLLRLRAMLLPIQGDRRAKHLAMRNHSAPSRQGFGGGPLGESPPLDGVELMGKDAKPAEYNDVVPASAGMT